MACIQLEHNASTSLLHYYLAASYDVDALLWGSQALATEVVDGGIFFDSVHLNAIDSRDVVTALIF